MNDELVLVRFAGLLRSGVSLPKALDLIGGMPDKPELRFLIEVCLETGSAVNYELNQVADLYRSIEKAKAKLAVAQSAPAASARLVIWLPLLVLGLAQLLGLDVLGSSLHNPLLLYSVGFGVMLLALAKFSSFKMISKAEPRFGNEGFYLLGVALASAGGASLNQAQNTAYAIYRRVFGTEPTDEELKQMAEIAMLVEHTGSRITDLLRSQAEMMQRKKNQTAQIKIERLNVKLLLPLGLIVLPAFVFIAIIPLMFSMLGDFR